MSDYMRAIYDAIVAQTAAQSDATAAKQDTGNTSLGSIATAVVSGALKTAVDAVATAVAAASTAIVAKLGQLYGTKSVAVTATTYATPLKSIRNNGTAGLISVKGTGDSAATDHYLLQGGEMSTLQVGEVTSIAAGMSCVGVYGP
jgi:hypothetical protein